MNIHETFMTHPQPYFQSIEPTSNSSNL